MRGSLKICIAGLVGGLVGWFLLSYLLGLPILAGILIGVFIGVLEYAVFSKAAKVLLGFDKDND